METEVWKPVVGYEGRDEVSNFGRVKSKERFRRANCGTFRRIDERIMKQCLDRDGYLSINLYNDCERKHALVHRLVAEAFIPNPNNLPQVNHKDERKTNNCIDNLEFCDAEYNTNYGKRNKKAGESLGKPVLCVELNITYQSAREAMRQTGIGCSKIGECCKGKRKTTGGYHWNYA